MKKNQCNPAGNFIYDHWQVPDHSGDVHVRLDLKKRRLHRSQGALPLGAPIQGKEGKGLF